MSGCFLKNLLKDFENSSANRSRGPTCTWQITFPTLVFSNMAGCSERNLPKDFGISSARCNMHSDSDSDSNSDSDSDCDYYDYYELTPTTTTTYDDFQLKQYHFPENLFFFSTIVFSNMSGCHFLLLYLIGC